MPFWLHHLCSFWKSELPTICWNSQLCTIVSNPIFLYSYDRNHSLWPIYRSELENKIPQGQSQSSVSYLDILLEKGIHGNLTTKLFDINSDLNYSIPYTCSITPSSSANGSLFSWLIQFARECSTYEQFSKRDKLLINKLVKQQSRLKSSLRKFYGRYNDFVSKYVVPYADWRFSY